jgi:hypothetical protein
MKTISTGARTSVRFNLPLSQGVGAHSVSIFDRRFSIAAEHSITSSYKPLQPITAYYRLISTKDSKDVFHMSPSVGFVAF